MLLKQTLILDYISFLFVPVGSDLTNEEVCEHVSVCVHACVCPSVRKSPQTFYCNAYICIYAIRVWFVFKKADYHMGVWQANDSCLQCYDTCVRLVQVHMELSCSSSWIFNIGNLKKKEAMIRWPRRPTSQPATLLLLDVAFWRNISFTPSLDAQSV